MPSESPFKLGLGSKTLNRAKIILGSLLLLFMLFAIAGIYQGVVSGDFDKVLIKPFREFRASLKESMTATPAPIPTLTPVSSTTTSTSTSTSKVIINQTVPVAPKTQPAPPAACYRMNIREGEFAGNKCYSQQDYEDLQYYLGRFQSAKLDLSSAEGFMKIDCGAAQTFEEKKADCEQSQKDKSAAEADVSKYQGIIQGIIAKGK